MSFFVKDHLGDNSLVRALLALLILIVVNEICFDANFFIEDMNSFSATVVEIFNTQ